MEESEITKGKDNMGFSDILDADHIKDVKAFSIDETLLDAINAKHNWDATDSGNKLVDEFEREEGCEENTIGASAATKGWGSDCY
ncbi:hypothetical protein GOP47_0005554 [Adiantum capillus-veneris]|uniref:Uncharacterized protein n=1 Tax=Adiantum capillus-veneris TaxID=13818 RepID=A0A9D4V5Y8_ADICA|nr:hypothetical protein GOP47_0005554 [Adiantum capillus-veneris]